MSNSEQTTLLITTSILDSYEWWKKCPPSWKTRAFNGIVASLRREPWTPHPTAERGIKFEDAIYKNHSGGSEKFRKIVDKCRGGKFQQTLKKEVTINGRKVLLFGKVDVIFPKKRIIDIKTTEGFRGNEKYLGGWQHKLYTYMSDVDLFEYTVVMFEEYPSNNIIGVYDIPYQVGCRKELWKDIYAGIWEFYEWLLENELFYDYEQIFSIPRWKR